MKSLFSSFLLLTLLFFQNNLNAQCIADAGSDKIICDGFNGIDSTLIGGSPTAIAGNAPYTYLWETTLTIGSFTLTASDFLDDVNAANPMVVFGGANKLKFYLTVTDSLGNSCRDSVKITFSSFGVTLQDKRDNIVQGDSVQIYPGVGGGIAPYTFQWSPTYGLSDPNIANPWASPDTSVSYVVTVTDSAGCQIIDPDAYEVFVSPVGIDEKSALEAKLNIFPNPITDQSFIFLGSNELNSKLIEIYDSNGKLIKEISPNSNRIQLDKTDFEAGIYFIQYIEDGVPVVRRKIIFQ